MIAPWRARANAYDWDASAALPLHRQGKVVGVLTLYANAISAFDEPAQNLSIEMAMDISFALDWYGDSHQRLLADEQLRLQATELALRAGRTKALLALPSQAERLPERDFLAYGVELAEQLTSSCIVFIHLVHEDQNTIELGSW